MMMERPTFMENKEWYYNDENEEPWKLYETTCYKLTDKAPREAVESYKKYCTTIYSYNLGYVPEFVYEEYRKHIARLNK